MKASFKFLADKFSEVDEKDNKDFIPFYEDNQVEIEDLTYFGTEEELYLCVVIHHTYGRSLLYEARNYQLAEAHLEIARALICNHESKFNLQRKNDVWYLQTLQHLLRISLDSKNYHKARRLLKELRFIDAANTIAYQREVKEINRIRTNNFFMILIYCGIGLIAMSITSRILSLPYFELEGRIGTMVGLVGLIGGYFIRHRKRKRS